MLISLHCLGRGLEDLSSGLDGGVIRLILHLIAYRPVSELNQGTEEVQ